jgi:HPt (histidine-containing phosphotransfer) domain-containing protein
MQILTPPNNISAEVYNNLVFLFIKEITLDFDILKKASVENDWEVVKKLSHKIGGVSSSYGALEVRSLAKSLEVSVNSIEDINKSGIENLENAITRLTLHIQSTFQQLTE